MNDEDLLERLAALEREPRRERWSERAAMRLCSLYEAATLVQRQFMRESVQVGRWRSPDVRGLADGAIREIPAQQRIRVALLLESIENGRHDLRDNLISLTLIYHGTVAVGMDVERLFEEVVPTEYSVRIVAVAVAGQRLIPFPGRMTALFVALLASLQTTICSRLELAAEILALRHQLAVLQRATPTRLRLRAIDRLLWVLLAKVWPNWRHAVQIVTPATVVGWHRRAFATYWYWKSRTRSVGRRRWHLTSGP